MSKNCKINCGFVLSGVAGKVHKRCHVCSEKFIKKKEENMKKTWTTQIEPKNIKKIVKKGTDLSDEKKIFQFNFWSGEEKKEEGSNWFSMYCVLRRKIYFPQGVEMESEWKLYKKRKCMKKRSL